MATRLWNFLTTDICDLAALNIPGRAADAADVVLALAELLAAEKPTLQQLAPLLTQLDSLLDAINAPLGKLLGAPLPFWSIGTGLLKVYGDATQTEPSLAQSVALISQAAYLDSFRDFVKRHPKVEQWLSTKDNSPQAKTITLQVKALGSVELTDEDAQLAALHFHQSSLAVLFNDALNARLVQLGASSEQANRIAGAVAKATNKRVEGAIAALAIPTFPCQG
ncbi:hypothetical protein [Nodosilinea sp. E11]|uniref:hypothetical protein n=1 Tax=Nodosilinea sp. E11 TaxID=3037479 RepID=UPI0029344667|nr:hypothetical protein [Nodosilinea sp. E11]WOD39170.1 hypothetical protein RRF56_23465 [Nodosilinea sp. E11]